MGLQSGVAEPRQCRPLASREESRIAKRRFRILEFLMAHRILAIRQTSRGARRRHGNDRYHIHFERGSQFTFLPAASYRGC